MIIIGNGAPAVIHSYQGKAFQCPFPIFTDPTLEYVSFSFHSPYSPGA